MPSSQIANGEVADALFHVSMLPLLFHSFNKMEKL
jgi:hypothetical protein